jgi:hypothetical protein
MEPAPGGAFRELRGEAVFVNQAAEPVATPELIERQYLPRAWFLGSLQ